jgi:hypothetical protein
MRKIGEKDRGAIRDGMKKDAKQDCRDAGLSHIFSLIISRSPAKTAHYVTVHELHESLSSKPVALIHVGTSSSSHVACSALGWKTRTPNTNSRGQPTRGWGA